MILIHELGHYAAAKWLGVRVEVFSIGFGKRLLGFRRGDTDYRISAIPLGGYVKMSGDNPMEERTGDPAEFLSHSRWHRFLIAIAGPAMNILLAVGLLTVVYMVHYEYPIFLDKPAIVAGVKHDSAAAAAGVQADDRIIRIDGVENPTWEQVYFKVMLSPNQPLNVTVRRGSQTFERQIVPKAVTASQVGSAGWYANESVIVGDMEPDMPAAKAGIKEGDKVLAMDGNPVPSIDAMIESLQETKDKPITLTILRDGQQLNVRVQPVLARTEAGSEKRYRIGFLNTPEMKVGSLPFTQAFDRSLDENKKGSVLILQLVQKLVQRKVSIRTISGPIGIAQDAGEAAAQKGWTPLLALTSAISLNAWLRRLVLTSSNKKHLSCL